MQYEILEQLPEEAELYFRIHSNPFPTIVSDKTYVVRYPVSDFKNEPPHVYDEHAYLIAQYNYLVDDFAVVKSYTSDKMFLHVIDTGTDLTEDRKRNECIHIKIKNQAFYFVITPRMSIFKLKAKPYGYDTSLEDNLHLYELGELLDFFKTNYEIESIFKVNGEPV